MVGSDYDTIAILYFCTSGYDCIKSQKPRGLGLAGRLIENEELNYTFTIS